MNEKEQIKKSRKKVEKTIREWGLIQSEEDRNFYDRISKMNMMSKISAYGKKLQDAITSVLYKEFFQLNLRNEENLRKLIDEQYDDRKFKILLADTYLRSKMGQEKLGLQ
jgi:hypothetical protein